MPQDPPYMRIRDSVECLLRLSDAVAARTGVIENNLGQELPLASLPKDVSRRLSSARNLVRFSEEDLAELQIGGSRLSEFTSQLDDRFEMRSQSLGHTQLERRPVAFHAHSTNLLLPTAVGSAIERFVIEEVLAMGIADSFDRALADDFAELFADTPLLGGRSGVQIKFQAIGGGRIAAVMKEVDSGRFLHFVVFVDALYGFSEGGLSGRNADPESLGLALITHMRTAAAHASEQPGFRDGITVFVGCGFGRTILVGLDQDLPGHWRLESIAAHDLVTLRKQSSNKEPC